MLENRKRVDSDDFIYNDDDIKHVCSGEEFSKLTHPLFDLIDNYAKENDKSNCFNLLDEDYFTSNSYSLKIKDIYYQVKLIVGQGSFVRINKTNLNEIKIKDFEVINYDILL